MNASPEDRSKRSMLGLTAALICFAISATAFSLSRRSATTVVEPLPPAAVVDPFVVRNAFFDERVRPVVAATGQADAAAADRAIQRIRETFAGYHRGVDPFVDDVTSWRARWEVLRRMPGDYARGTRRVETYLQTKIAEHLFDDVRLRRDLNQSLVGFREDVRGNQNLMLADIRAAVESSGLDDVRVLDIEPFVAAVTANLENEAKDAATASIVRGLLIEVGSAAGGFVFEQLVVQLIARLATTAAAGAGGAAASGSAVGGGGGAIAGGPVGAAVGIVAGLVVGLVIDVWASKKFEKELGEKMHRTLDDLEASVLGDRADGIGVVSGLRQSCDLLAQSYEEVLREQIVGSAQQ